MSPKLLVDVNVWVSLLADGNSRHHQALQWFESLEDGQAVLCRVVQLSIVRLLSDVRIVGAPANPSATRSWRMIQDLLEDGRVVFAPEPAAWENVFPALLRDPRPAPKLVADAYLAAFAIAGNYRLTSFDSGFKQFAGLDFQQL